jgi:thiamine biosynthesis protein ThiS
MITVTVNGEKRQIAEKVMVLDLLKDLGLGGRRVAVERNREIIGRDSYASAVVRDGDVFEIIEFVGGGF